MASSPHHDAALPRLPLSARIYKFLNKKDNYAEAPPNGGITAWLQVVACFFIFMNNFGLASAFGVYQAYYQKVMFPEHNASTISWIGTLQASLTLIVGILSGPLFDRGYFFSTVVVASTGLVFSFMMQSLCTQYWQVILCQGLLGGICTGMLYIPSISQLPLYFTTKRGLAIGIVLSGASVGGIVYPLMFRKLLPTIGFSGATRAIGYLALSLLAISVILIKPLRLPNRPKKLRDPTMFKDPHYITFFIAAFLLFCGMMIPYFDCATYWLAIFDQNIDSAFYTLLIINGGNFIGRIGITALSDYGVGPEDLMIICTIGLAALGFGWIGTTTRASYHAFLVLWGFFSGGAASLPACVMPYMTPRPEYFATRLGVVYAAAGVGILIGAPIANAFEKRSSGFLGAQLWTGVTSFVGLVAVVHAAHGARKSRKAIQRKQREGKSAAREEVNSGTQSSESPINDSLNIASPYPELLKMSSPVSQV
ncbi:hypothetical protein ANO11243_017630 [Dothideomycetidae sp. 11243]|nr:hypothetical protein ANO11243_017630 [fungal sp. No.11243]